MTENKNNKKKPTLSNKEFYNLMIKYRLENYDERKKIVGSNQNEAEKVAYQVSQDFCTLASLTYMDKFFKTVYKAQEYVGNYEDYPIPKDSVYKEIMEKSNEISSTILNTYSGFSTPQGRMENELNFMKGYVDNEICKYEVNGAMDALKSLGVKKYKYICEDKYNSCRACRDLAEKKFHKISEAIEGVNLPPIHPNCKCTIGSYIENGKTSDEEEGYKFKLEYFIKKIMKSSYYQPIVNYIFNLNKTLVKLDGKKYNYNPNASKNIGIVDDKILNYDNLTKEEKEIFDLIKLKDECKSTVEREKIIKKAYDLMIKYIASGQELPFDFFKNYDYYKVGRDVTQEIYDIIDLYKEKYKKESERAWVINMPIFNNLVRGCAELDLKNRAQFKTNSTYIFEGEIVDADALGNTVYGYLGKYFGFPENVLLVGGGFAQNQAKTTSDNFKYFNADDPKDQFRILQGMLMYDDDISSSYSNQHKNKIYELNIISKVNQYII